MQEIKLIILIILTICSYVKYKQKDNHHKNARKGEVKLEEVPQQQYFVNLQQPSHLQKEVKKNDQPLLISKHSIQKFIQIESDILTKYQPRTLNQQCSEIIQRSSDFNDIFGGQYQKCKEGKTFQLDKDTILFNSYFIQKQSPFCHNTIKRGQLASNYELFENIRGALQQKNLYIDEPIPQVGMQRPNDIDMFQNFTFNGFNVAVLNQNIQMVQQADEEAFKDSSQSKIIKKKLKKKKILKPSKTYIRTIRNVPIVERKQQKNKTKPKIRLIHPSKSKRQGFRKFINLEEQIKKKEIQLSILKKIYTENDI